MQRIPDPLLIDIGRRKWLVKTFIPEFNENTDIVTIKHLNGQVAYTLKLVHQFFMIIHIKSITDNSTGSNINKDEFDEFNVFLSYMATQLIRTCYGDFVILMKLY